MLIYFARLPFMLPLLIYGILALIVPDFAQAHHAIWLAFGISAILLLDTALAALEARQQAADRQQAATRPAVFLGNSGHPPADPHLN